MPYNVTSGQSVIMNLTIPTGNNTAFKQLGNYTVGLDMVQEFVKWFGNEIKVSVKVR
jgi:hypothetical protein